MNDTRIEDGPPAKMKMEIMMVVDVYIQYIHKHGVCIGEMVGWIVIIFGGELLMFLWIN